MRQIIPQAGVLTLWSGLTPNLIGNSVSWGLYFLGYNVLKTHMLRTMESEQVAKAAREGQRGAMILNPPQKLGPLHHTAAASLTGAGVTLLTNPIWVLKTRMVVRPQDFPMVGLKGFVTGMRGIVKSEGVRALYSGVGPGLLNVSHGTVQFVTYEQVRSIMMEGKDDPGEGLVSYFRFWFLLLIMVSLAGARFMISLSLATQSVIESLGGGAISKIIATWTTYPFQLVRSRMQTKPVAGGPEWTTMTQCVRSLLRSVASSIYIPPPRPT